VSNRGFRPSDPRIGDGRTVGLHVSALPCDDFTGSTTYRGAASSAGAEEVVVANGTGLLFRVDPDNLGIWRTVEGTVAVSYDSTAPFEDGTCTSSGATSFTAADHARLVLLPEETALAFLGMSLPFVPVPPTLHVTMTCTSSSGTFTVTQDLPYFGTTWFFSGPDPLPLSPGATVFSGSYSTLVGTQDERWTWSFEKAQ